MKVLLFLIGLFVSVFVFGQDTIIKKNGTIEAVKILDIRPQSNLMIYEINGTRNTVQLDGIQSYILHSDIAKGENTAPSSETVPDTIVKKDGTILIVSVLKVDLKQNIIRYEKEGSVITSSLDDIESYTAHNPQFFNIPNNESVTLNFSEPELERVSKIKYEYGPFSISSNLFALLPIVATNSRITIEPEYDLNQWFSIKIPMVIGITRSYSEGVDYSNEAGTYIAYSYDERYYPNYTPPVQSNRELMRDVIIQGGITPKFYFNRKSKSIISMYGSTSLNFGIADAYSMTRYDRLGDTLLGSEEYNYENGSWEWYTTWDKEQTRTEALYYDKNVYSYFNFELMFGSDFNLSRLFTFTLEVGYGSNFIITSELVDDKIYTAVFNDDYILNYLGPNQAGYQYRGNFRARLLLTYRFGGKRINKVLDK
ncbi:MAG: hypothetical protein EP333_03220 [Bacteroidetes bacterium]|nr:MAG: hypothetical protein EP333_03220 [Bacteroidota bacterium]